jgi:N-acetylneuraminic acid mutarotase
MPQERTENSVAALDGLVYVAGGFTGGSELPTELFIYDPASDAWREGAPVPEGRHHAPLAASGGRLYLVGGLAGGSGGDWQPTDTLFVYDVAADSWSEGPAMPEPRGAHAVAVTDEGRIHVVGGSDGGARAEQFVFDPAAGTWSTLPAMPTPREHIGAAYHDGVIYVATGRASGVSDLRTFEAYDIEAQEWTSLPEVPTGRSGVAVVAFQNGIYVFGGETFNGESRTYDEAERFDPAAGSWQALPPMPTARHGLGAGVLNDGTGDGILVVGGGPEAGLTFSGVAELWRP